jgi:hypothetical protein
MWDGYIQFYIDLQDGKWSRWVAQGNEHRFVFSRLLFWIDIRFFGGLSQFLVACHLVLIALLWATLAAITSVLLRSHRQASLATLLLLLAPCFSWLQAENIDWGFQSQFFLAYLFPLVAFACLGASIGSRRGTAWFAAATVAGVCSVGTMANGNAALPLLIAMVVLTGQRVRGRVLVLLPVMAAMLYLYFNDFFATNIPPAGWMRHVEFAFAFLGSPAGVALGSTLAACVGGAAFLAAAVFATVVWFRSADRSPLQLALITFVHYVVLTGALVAYGRAGLGLECALMSRYCTPVLLGWTALIALAVAQVRERRWLPVALWTLAVLVPGALLWPQLDALDDWRERRGEDFEVAALGMDLGIRDEQAVGSVYPFLNERFWQLIAEAQRRGLSVFSLAKMVEARESIGKSAAALGLVERTGSIDVRAPVSTDPGRLKAGGWVVRADGEPRAAVYEIADAAGVIVGAGLPVRRQPEAAPAAGGQERVAVEGYLCRDPEGPIRVFGRK